MYVEITQEAFKALVTDEEVVDEVVESINYRDLIYNNYGMKIIHRHNYLTGNSYHIMDINY